MKMRGLLLGVLLWHGTAGGALRAEQTVATAAPLGEVNETYGRSDVAGGDLVGLSIGSAEWFDPQNVRIAVSPKDSVLCVSAISRDGLYFARTPYQKPPEAFGAREVRLTPFTVKFEDQLSNFNMSDIALLALQASSAECFEPDALYLPLLEQPEATIVRLNAYFNTGNQDIAMTLTDDGSGRQTAARCSKPDGARIGYDVICRVYGLKLGNQGRTVTLDFTLDDGLQTTPLSYKILLPSAPEG